MRKTWARQQKNVFLGEHGYAGVFAGEKMF